MTWRRFRTRFRPVLGGVLGAALLWVAFTPVSGAGAQERKVVVFAAASLKNALDEVARNWEAKTGTTVTVSYAASSALAKQIEEGAPADIFISADLDWMDELAKGNLIKPETRDDLLGNRIVLVAPADSTVTLQVAPGMQLQAALGGGKLAMADTAAVPAGKYGKAALQSLGVWDSVQHDVAQARMCGRRWRLSPRRGAARHRLRHRRSSGVPCEGARHVCRGHAPCHRLSGSPHRLIGEPDAEDLITFIGSDEAGVVFEKHGFVPLD
jgi:molybdate transport system substrate-binding protein